MSCDSLHEKLNAKKCHEFFINHCRIWGSLTRNFSCVASEIRGINYKLRISMRKDVCWNERIRLGLCTWANQNEITWWPNPCRHLVKFSWLVLLTLCLSSTSLRISLKIFGFCLHPSFLAWLGFDKVCDRFFRSRNISLLLPFDPLFYALWPFNSRSAPREHHQSPHASTNSRLSSISQLSRPLQ
jgi:hypothetical protein